MADLKISQFTDGGAVQTTDEIAAVRDGENVKVYAGSAAAADLGTAPDQVPTNSDLGEAAFLNASGNVGDAVVYVADSAGAPMVPGITQTYEVYTSATDTIPGYLEGKIIAGSNVTVTKNTDSSGQEILVIAAAGSSGIPDGDKGDITVSSSGTVWTIDSGVIDGGKVNANLDLSGKTTFLVPYNASPTISSNGAFAYDSTVTNWSHGIPRGYAGESLDYVVMPTANMASPTDRQAVIYDSAAQENKYDTVGPVLSATQATTSGTSKDFTGIPSWARIVTVNISGLSTSGTSIPIIQFLVSGGADSSGYTGVVVALQTGTSQAALSSGVLFETGWTAASVTHGVIVFSMLESSTNTWAFKGQLGRSDTARGAVVAGSKSLLSAVTGIRVTTVGGTDTFDAGKVSITYQ